MRSAFLALALLSWEPPTSIGPCDLVEVVCPPGSQTVTYTCPWGAWTFTVFGDCEPKEAP